MEREATPRRRLLGALRETTADVAVAMDADGREAYRVTVEALRQAVEGAAPPVDAAALGVPPEGPVRRRLDRLAASLGAAERAAFDPRVVTEGYAAQLSSAERRARGQFYTPPPVATALVRWAVAPAEGLPRVLDPAAGTGTFLLEAHRRLAERFPAADGGTLADHLVGVDVDRTALDLAAASVAAEGAGPPRTHDTSFFALEPDDLDPVDAVVGNPPFVAAADRETPETHYRAHLEALGPAGATPYASGPSAIGARADVSVYFVTQATRFLQPGGRLAFVLPSKWLAARYGRAFRAFLEEYYRIAAVVGFDGRPFADALVDASLLFLERRSAPADPEHVVRFVRVRDAPDPAELCALVDADVAVPDGERRTVVRSAHARTVGVRQAALAAAHDRGPLDRFLVAPPSLLALLEADALVPLDDLATVARGAMTGSTAFFFPDAAAVDAHGIEPRFRRPALKSTRGTETLVLAADDVDRWFVDVHEYVAAVRAGHDGGDGLEAAVKRSLEADGYDGLRSWIRAAEAAGEHRGSTCASRDVWFDYGPPPRPAVLVPKLLRERRFCVFNRAGAVPSNAVDGVDVDADVDPLVLFGVLNASVTRAMMEVWGRNEAGMLQLMTYETASLPVPDVRAMTDAERARIREAAAAVVERGSPTLSPAHRDRLDAAVQAAMGVGPPVERVQAIEAGLRDRRVASGEAAAVVRDGPR